VVQYAGSIVRSSHVILPRYIRKNVTESLASNTAMQNDDDINAVPMPAGKFFNVQFFAAFTGASGGDIKFSWNATGGLTPMTSRLCQGPTTGMTDTLNTAMRSSRHNMATEVPYGVEATASCGAYESFMCETSTSGTTGWLTLQWAQATSSTTATQLTSSTFCVITECDPG
jgi:hypothetical protein